MPVAVRVFASARAERYAFQNGVMVGSRVGVCVLFVATAGCGSSDDSDARLRSGTSKPPSSSGGVPGGSGGAPADASMPDPGGARSDASSAAGATSADATPPTEDAPRGECGAGEIRCGGICTRPSPRFGCGLVCGAPCAPAPAHGTTLCLNQACDFECDDGYERSFELCVPRQDD